MDEVLIIGGGPAGLATAACLKRRGIPARILEQGGAVAQSWEDYYDRLHLHTGKHLSGLPGRPVPRDAPLYLPRAKVVDYFQDYARHFDLAVSTGERVLSVRREPDGSGDWRVETSRGVRRAPAVVVATGYFLNPHRPAFPGQGRFGGPIIHSSEYRNPASVAGERVLVVGLGNSAAEIAVELAGASRTVGLSIRAGANIVPRDLFGVLPIQYAGYLLRRLPPVLARPVVAGLERQGRRRLRSAGLPPASYATLERIPVIGLDLIRAIRARRVTVYGAIERLDPGRVHFADGRTRPFDAIVLGTGYTPVLSFLRDLAPDPATLIPETGVASPAKPGLYFVGFHRTTAGMLYLIGRREAPEAARLIAAQLAHAAAT